MKIAWISSWPPHHCGIADYSYDLVNAIRDLGHSVEIVCHTDGGSPREEIHPVINPNSPDWCEKPSRIISHIQPDILHIQHEFGLYRRHGDFASGLFRPLFLWKTEKRFPVIITYHSIYTKLNPKQALYIDIVQKLVDAGIVHEFCQYKYLPLNLGRNLHNIYVIPHGAKHIESYSKARFKEKIGLKPSQKVIGLLGWFVPTKGFERVLKNWDYIAGKVGPSLQLVIGGGVRGRSRENEKYKQKLFNIINSSKYKEQIKVILDIPSQERYLDVLKSFDVMVLPYKLASQSGNLANSFACGVPVVASGIEGLKEEVKRSGAGIVVSPKDEEELTKSIITLIENEPLRNKLARRAIWYVKNKINWHLVAQKHIELYKRLLNQRKD